MFLAPPLPFGSIRTLGCACNSARACKSLRLHPNQRRLERAIGSPRTDLSFGYPRSSCEFDLAVVVAVTVVRVMQVAGHQIVDVIAMRDLLVTAIGTVNMAGRMCAAIVLRCAALRVTPAGGDLVIVDVIAVLMVHVAIVKVVGVSIVAHGDMSAVRTVRVGMALRAWYKFPS